MKNALLLLLIVTIISCTNEKTNPGNTAVENNLPPSLVTDLILDGYTGKVRTVYVNSNTAAFTDEDKWVITDSGYHFRVRDYDTAGNIMTISELYKENSRSKYSDITHYHKLDSNTTISELSDEMHPTRQIIHFVDPFTKLMQEYVFRDKQPGADSMLAKESRTTYNSNLKPVQQITRYFGSEPYTITKEYIYAGDTTHEKVKYSSQPDTSLYTTVILDRDKKGNITKEVTTSYTGNFSVISLYRYEYHPPTK